MAEMFVVQYGTPLPPINRKPRPRKYPLASTKVGGWFFVPNRTSKSVSAYISRISKSAEGEFRTRDCWARPLKGGAGWELIADGDETRYKDAVKGAGVWRIT